jgi:outer membrane protein assembly factor BamD
MNRKSLHFLFILLISIAVTSCNGYNKILKSKDFEKKYEAAVEYYNKKDFFKAQQLFDELLVIYRGTPKAQDIFFMYAYTYYNMKNYEEAALYFQKYAATFPKSDKAEEAYFMSAYCKYLESPVYSLDQTSTYDAISQMQSFINIFPNSPRVQECNTYIDELRLKIEKKKFERAKLYYTTGYDKSAIAALKLFIRNNPGSVYCDEASYLILDASYRYAVRSVAAKKEERLKEAREAYTAYLTAFPSGKYLAKSSFILKKIESETENNK